MQCGILDVSPPAAETQGMGPVLRFALIPLWIVTFAAGDVARAEELQIIKRVPCKNSPKEICLFIEQQVNFHEAAPKPLLEQMPGAQISVTFELLTAPADVPGTHRLRSEYPTLALTRDWVAKILPPKTRVPRNKKERELNALIDAARDAVIRRVAEIHYFNAEHDLRNRQNARVVQIPGDRDGRLRIEFSGALRGEECEQSLTDALRFVLDQELREPKHAPLRKLIFSQDLLTLTPLDCAAISSPAGRASCEGGANLSWVKVMARLSEFSGARARYGCVQVQVGSEVLGEQFSTAPLECESLGKNCRRGDNLVGHWKDCSYPDGRCREGDFDPKGSGNRIGHWTVCFPDGRCGEETYDPNGSGNPVGYSNADCYGETFNSCNEGEYSADGSGYRVGRWKDNCHNNGVCNEGEYDLSGTGFKVGKWKEFYWDGKTYEEGEYASNKEREWRIGLWKHGCTQSGKCRNESVFSAEGSIKESKSYAEDGSYKMCIHNEAGVCATFLSCTASGVCTKQ